MKRYLKLYYLFNKYRIKITLQNKAGVIFFTVGKILRFSIFFIFIYNLLAHTRFLAGYTLTQTIIFFLTYNLVDTLAQLLFREVYWFRPLVVSGELDTILIKPYHPFIKILFGGIDILDLFMTIPYTLLLVYFTLQLPSISLLDAMLYSILLINALCIAASFHIAAIALAVLTTQIDHVLWIYRDLTRMASLPMDIYQEPIRILLTFVIPIGIMMTFPVKALFGVLSPLFFVISFTVATISLIASISLWNKALKKYQSWGGWYHVTCNTKHET